MGWIEVAIAVVKKDRKILICQRKKDDSFGGLWEFPGGKCEPGESLDQCLARELKEEIGITVRILEKLTPIQHDYGKTRVRLNPFLCDHVAGQPVPIECQRVQWVDPASLADYHFPPANGTLLSEVAAKMSADE